MHGGERRGLLNAVQAAGGIAGNRRQRLIQLVRQAGGQLAHGHQPGSGLQFFGLQALALGKRPRLGVVGVNAVDYSGYPDCRPEYGVAYENMANLATKTAVEGQRLHIHPPLMALSKAQIIQRGTALGVDYGLTVTSYQADTDGRACGICDSCRLRREGFAAADLPDPTRYAPTRA